MKGRERLSHSPDNQTPAIMPIFSDAPMSDEEQRDILGQEGAGEKHKLPRHLSRKIAFYPKSLRSGQLTLLMEAREESKQRETGIPQSQTEKEKRERRLAQKKELREITEQPAFVETMKDADEQTREQFETVIEESGSIDELIVNCNLGLVLARANAIHTEHMTFADRFQEGIAGFMQGLDKYDRSRYVIDKDHPEDAIFIHTVTEYVNGAIKKGKADQDEAIRIPQGELYKRNHALGLARSFEKDNNVPPSRNEWIQLVMDHEKITREKAESYVALAMQPTAVYSIDKPLDQDEGDAGLREVIKTEPAKANVFSERLNAMFASLTAIEQEILTAIIEDGLPRDEVAERLGIRPRTVGNLYNDLLERLQVNPAVQDAWIEMGGNPDFLISDEEAKYVGINTEKKRTTNRADTLEYRVFSEKRKSLLDPRTTEKEFAIVTTLANNLSPDDRTDFARALLMKIARTHNEQIEFIALELLGRLDTEGLNMDAITDRYLHVVEGQKHDANPNSLLAAGRILAEVMHTDPQSLWDIQAAWTCAIGTNSAENSAWREIVPEVNDLAIFLTYAEQLKLQNDLEALKQLTRNIRMPEPEKKEPQEQIIDTFLNEYSVKNFFNSNSEEWTVIRGVATLDIRELSPDQTTDLARRLIQIIGIDDPAQVDRRDGALELLSRINFEQVDIDSVQDTYVEALKSQTEESDTLGSAYSLYEAGTVLEPHFSRDYLTKRAVTSAWSSIHEQHKEDPEWQSIAERFKAAQYPALSEVERDIVESFKNKSAKDVANEYGLESPEAVYALVHELARKGKMDYEPKKRGPQTSPEHKARNERIVADLQAGVPPKEIARREGFTSIKSVYTVLRKYEKEHGVKVDKPDHRKGRSAEIQQPADQEVPKESNETTIFDDASLKEPNVGGTVGQSIADQEAERTAYDQSQKKGKSK